MRGSYEYRRKDDRTLKSLPLGLYLYRSKGTRKAVRLCGEEQGEYFGVPCLVLSGKNSITGTAPQEWTG